MADISLMNRFRMKCPKPDGSCRSPRVSVWCGCQRASTCCRCVSGHVSVPERAVERTADPADHSLSSKAPGRLHKLRVHLRHYG